MTHINGDETTLEHLTKRLSVSTPDEVVMRKESPQASVQFLTECDKKFPVPNGEEISSDFLPTYADGVRVVLDKLDEHRVDIEKALCYGRNCYTYDDVCKKTIEGEYIFIPLPKSVMLCEVAVLPNYKMFHCFIAAGDLDELLTAGTTQLGEGAKAYGCECISITGRRGWERHLKKQGWTAPLTTMYKEVTS